MELLSIVAVRVASSADSVTWNDTVRFVKLSDLVSVHEVVALFTVAVFTYDNEPEAVKLRVAACVLERPVSELDHELRDTLMRGLIVAANTVRVFDVDAVEEELGRHEMLLVSLEPDNVTLDRLLDGLTDGEAVEL